MDFQETVPLVKSIFFPSIPSKDPLPLTPPDSQEPTHPKDARAAPAGKDQQIVSSPLKNPQVTNTSSSITSASISSQSSVSSRPEDFIIALHKARGTHRYYSRVSSIEDFDTLWYVFLSKYALNIAIVSRYLVDLNPVCLNSRRAQTRFIARLSCRIYLKLQNCVHSNTHSLSR
jgi:hypothetical protein